jgi:hypothetical protein
MTAEQREIYGDAFAAFATALNRMQSAGLDASVAAERVVAAAERPPPPIRVAVGPDAEEVLKLVHEQSDEELDELRVRLAGLEAPLAESDHGSPG